MKLIQKIALIFSSFSTFFIVTGMIPISTSIQNFFNISEEKTSFVITFSSLVCGVTAFFSGLTIDRFGAKLIMLCGCLLMSLSGIVLYNVQDLFIFTAFRGVLGISNAMIMTSTFSYAATYIEDKNDRKQFFSIHSILMVCAVLSTTFITTFVMQKINLRSVFLIYFFAGIVGFVFNLSLQRHQSTTTRNVSIVEGFKGLPLKTYLIPVCVSISFMFFYGMAVEIPFKLRNIGFYNELHTTYIISSGSIISIIFTFIYRAKFTNVSDFILHTLCCVMLFGGYTIFPHASNIPMIILSIAFLYIPMGYLPPSLNPWITDGINKNIIGRVSSLITVFIYLGIFLSAYVPILLKRNILFIYGLLLIYFAVVFLLEKVIKNDHKLKTAV